MNQAQIFEQFSAILHQFIENDEPVITEQTPTENLEYLDSFNRVTLIVAVESHFKIRFQPAETEELKNVGDYVNAITRKLALQKP